MAFNINPQKANPYPYDEFSPPPTPESEDDHPNYEFSPITTPEVSDYYSDYDPSEDAEALASWAERPPVSSNFEYSGRLHNLSSDEDLSSQSDVEMDEVAEDSVSLSGEEDPSEEEDLIPRRSLNPFLRHLEDFNRQRVNTNEESHCSSSSLSDAEMIIEPGNTTPVFQRVGLAALPLTPGHNQPPPITEPLFTGTRPMRPTEDPNLIGITIGSEPVPIYTYRNPMAGRSFHVVRQPSQRYSCGAGVALMKLLDLGHANTIAGNQNFWNDYATAQMMTAEELVELFQENNIEATLHNYGRREANILFQLHHHIVEDGEAVLNQLRRHIESSGQPVILAINHPTVDGHWIIVDSINDRDAIIRDPAMGFAHRISREELAKMIFEEDKNVTQTAILF